MMNIGACGYVIVVVAVVVFGLAWPDECPHEPSAAIDGDAREAR
jgi:hypothetical protein